MNVAPDAPTRPALRYYGGKWNLAPWIISHFPPHKNYVEPCGGAASVLLQKPRSPLETYNDLDGNVVNFFRVLRERPNDLVRAIELTPWARSEFELSLQPAIDDTEKARRFFFRLSASMHGGGACSASDWQHWTTAGSKTPLSQIGTLDHLYQIADRLYGVQIENKPFEYVVDTYDGVDSLLYFDPPYVIDTRAQSERYSLEWDNDKHRTAAKIMHQCKGMVVVSGYACPLYADLYESHGWTRRDKEAQTNSGGKRIESLWLSPRTWAALQNGFGLPLFAAADSASVALRRDGEA